MAPCGRPRKGLARMDAAVDAMQKYGFAEKSVREEMKNLLNIYGEDGWTFIEDDSYKVLLESLLEKSAEEQQQHKDSYLEYGGGDESNVTALEAGPSTQIMSCSNTEALQSAPVSPTDNAMTLYAGPSEFQSGSTVEAWQTVPSPSTDEPLDSVFENDMSLVSSLMTRISDGGHSFPRDDAEVNMSEDMDVDLVDLHVTDVSKGVTDVGGASGVGKDGNILRFHIHSRRSVPFFRPDRTRRPCYGWISSDDEDEGNMVRLEPEPLPEDVESLFIEATAKYGPKRRWDVRPGNV